MKEKIEKLFKNQLKKLKDPNLREKVVDIWTDLAKKGGWKAEDLEKIPFTVVTNAKGINLIEHTIVVTEGALAIAKLMLENFKHLPYKINFDWLVAGGLLHDVGKLVEIEKSAEGYRKSYSGECMRHPISGAIAVAKAGLPEEIVNIVACHAKEGEGRPQRIETILIHQIDFATFSPLVMSEKGVLIREKQ